MVVPPSYSAVTTKNLMAMIAKNAPGAPTCPKLETTEYKLEIQYRSGKENECGVVFEREYVEYKISREIESFHSSDHQLTLQRIACIFRSATRKMFPDSTCWMVGSYAANVEIHTSDLDFTVEIPSVEGVNEFKKLMAIRKEIIRNRAFEGFAKIYVQKGNIPVLQMIHTETKVSIDVSIDNDSSKRNTQLLSWYGQLDSRFQHLCRAMKAWASKCGVESARFGRLNSFSLCLMLILYLQVETKPAVLPNIQELFPEIRGNFIVENDGCKKRNLKDEIIKQGKFKFNENKSSLAALFIGFLKYYAEFDFERHWISVKNGKVMEKRWNEKMQPLDGLPDNCHYIVVEDPFLEIPRNCAGTVKNIVYVKRIQSEFRNEYFRILKNKTIFNLGPCNWSRVLTDNGKKRDLQIEEVKEIKRKLEAALYENIPCGNVSELDEWREQRPDPREYWDLGTERRRRRFEITPHWPEMNNPYEILDNFLL